MHNNVFLSFKYYYLHFRIVVNLKIINDILNICLSLEPLFNWMDISFLRSSYESKIEKITLSVDLNLISTPQPDLTK